MPGFDVLPSALVHVAVGVRAFALDVTPVRAAALADPGLTAAFAEYAASWTRAALVLVEQAEECSRSLQESARTYGAVEALLVPRALR
jgi:hypothetical protein